MRLLIFEPHRMEDHREHLPSGDRRAPDLDVFPIRKRSVLTLGARECGEALFEVSPARVRCGFERPRTLFRGLHEGRSRTRFLDLACLQDAHHASGSRLFHGHHHMRQVHPPSRDPGIARQQGRAQAFFLTSGGFIDPVPFASIEQPARLDQGPEHRAVRSERMSWRQVGCGLPGRMALRAVAVRAGSSIRGDPGRESSRNQPPCHGPAGTERSRLWGDFCW